MEVTRKCLGLDGMNPVPQKSRRQDQNRRRSEVLEKAPEGGIGGVIEGWQGRE